MDSKHRVHADCEVTSKMKSVSWFVLPPVQEYYYKSKNLSYKPLPTFRSDCINPTAVVSMEMIYPRQDSKIFIPRELDGSLGSTLFEVAHRNREAIVYWHLDGNYVGSTSGTHRLHLSPAAGQHKITLIDDQGEILERKFQIMSVR